MDKVAEKAKIIEIRDLLEKMAKEYSKVKTDNLVLVLPSKEDTKRIFEAAKRLADLWDFYKGHQIAKKYR